MKILFVVQRYGNEVNGGAEVHARQLAEHVAAYTEHEVEVATTKAIDYVTWKNEYDKDIDEVGGLKVYRFPVERERDQKEFNKFSEKIASGHSSIAMQEKWMRLQGPCCPALIKWLEENRDNYDCFVFLTYLYYTTYFGLRAVGKKSILIPTAHDEWTIHLPLFQDMFKLPGAFFYNTTEEKELVNRLFDTKEIPDNAGFGGVGVEVPEKTDGDDFRSKYGIDDDFIIYVGRIDENKCCPELFSYFREYKNRHKDSKLKLALAGKEIIKVPAAEDIVSLGFIPEQDKFDAIKASKLLVLPSRFESLSIVVLEAMKLKRPVLVNGGCNVLSGHCLKSNAGLFYRDYYEFEGCLDYLLSHDRECALMGENGVSYVDSNYSWKVIVERLNKMIEETVSRLG